MMLQDSRHRPAHPAAADAAPSLWYTLVNPEPGRSRMIRRRLADGQSVRLEIRMEVLELDPITGRALLWIPDAQGAREPRLACARLSPARQAEVMLALQQGTRVSVLLHFDVLDRHGNGFAAVTDSVEGRLVVEPDAAEHDLAELLG